MNRSSLIDAFKTFSPKEIKEFGEFVTSPFFNKNVNVVRLFEQIRKCYPAFEAGKIEKEKVFSRIFPGKPYKDSTLRLLMYYLYELVEKFIAYNRFTSDDLRFQSILLEELHERRLYKDFEKTVETAYKQLDEQTTRDGSYYMYRYMFAEHKLSYLAELYLGKYEKYLTSENLHLFSDNITHYYLISVLKYYAITLNTNYLYNVKADTSVFEQMLKNFNVEQFENVPMIVIYYRVIMLFLTPDDEENYYKLKDLVVKYENQVGHAIGDLYINLENYSVRMARHGKSEFIKESLDVYNLELAKGTYLIHGSMPNSFYTSFVVNACKMKDFDSALEFINKYKTELQEVTREQYYFYSMSFLEYEKGNYEKALEYLAKTKAEEVYLKMDIRLLQCRIYYVLVWNIPLQSLLDTFKKTVQNNKYIADIRKEQYNKFIKYTNQLNNIRYKSDKHALAVVIDDLEKDDYFAYKSWVVEEAAKLYQSLK
ncbi:MAG: hypothetical protein IAE90_10755 [Ignavibacteria bacterium]|nr:hypothetical protein [Ignavibacteria bacterium]